MWDNESEKTNIEELLPFFVNGTLDDDERRLVERVLDHSDGLRQQVEVLRLVRSQMQADEPAQSNGEIGLARLMREIDSKPVRAPANNPKPPLFRLSGLAAGVAAATIVLAFVAGTAFQRQEPVYIQASGGGISATLTVSFQPDVTQKLMAETLLSHGLIIVDGPSAGGFFRLELFDHGDLNVVAEALMTQTEVFNFVDDPQ